MASGIVSPRATFAEIMSAMPNSKKKASEIPFEKRMETLEKLGLVETFDPEEAEAMGAFEETALSDEDALDAVSPMSPEELQSLSEYLEKTGAKIKEIDPEWFQLPFEEAIERLRKYQAKQAKSASRKKALPVKPRESFVETRPVQLTLLGLELKKEYTNQFDFWSFVPRFVYGRKGNDLIKKDGGNATIKREFRIGDEKYSLSLQTYKLSRINKDTKKFEDKDCFLGEREEFVEEALIKMACSSAIFLDGQAALDFTIQQLQKELAESGHSYAYNELIDALLILNGSVVTVYDSNGNPKYQSQSITSVGFKNPDDKSKHSAKTKCFVIFHPSITEGIKNGSYRQTQYKLIMEAGSVAERKLCKKMSFFFTQAAWNKPYRFYLSRFLENSGLEIAQRPTDKKKYMVNVLNSMQEKKILREYSIKDVVEGRTAVDYEISVIASHSFVDEIKRANAIQSSIQTRLEQLTLTEPKK